MRVVNWFRRRKKRIVVPRLHSRGEVATGTNRIDFAELTPGLPQFLAQAAYLQLTVFEALSEAVANAPTTEVKEVVSEVAGHSLDKHHDLVEELERRGADAGDAMKHYAPSIDAYRARTHGATWLETVTTCYLTAGLLDDFSRRLATGLAADAAARIQQIYAKPDGHELLVDQLREAIDADPRIASKLAMWGRRLVGDTLLIARTALALPPSSPSEEARLEPVFTEIIAAHTRRMDALGLTA
jgi:hypothetical protein